MNPFTLVKLKSMLLKKPDIEGQNVKVWTIKQDEMIRVNYVEMSGELRLHSHPDADHSLMLLKGRVQVQVDQEMIFLEPGDFISIPAHVPHKYWSMDGISTLVSMDAPYYDPSQTLNLE